MKCIYCETDSKRSERTDRRCPKCVALFAFEPSEGDPFTDMAFKAMIERVSAGGTVRWGREHLYYEACRVAGGRRRRAWNVGYGVAFFGGLVGVALTGWPLVFGLGLAAGGVVWMQKRDPHVALSEQTFDRLWAKWRAAHPTSRGLIERPPEQQAPKVSEADMAHYSFDRAVICDRARTVDLLLANNFHFENNCAVLGANGYPRSTFELVRKMLRRNPRLQVFVLHDATEEGCNLARRLAEDPDWFKGIGRVIDVGVRPNHAKAFRGAFQRATGGVDNTRGLLPGEADWLGRYTFELAAVRPEQVIKRLFRAMNNNPEPPPRPGESIGIRVSSHDHGDHADHPDDAGVDASDSFGVDLDSFSGDADASDGGGDSFG